MNPKLNESPYPYNIRLVVKIRKNSNRFSNLFFKKRLKALSGNNDRVSDKRGVMFA